MKRQVQEPGIRRWFGGDWIDMQNEIYAALEGFFEPYGNMIIKGCTISDNGGQWRIATGLVGLFSPTADEYRICRFPQTDVDDVHSAIYVILTSENVTRAYKTGGTLAVVKEYKAQISTVQPGSGEYLTINANGNNVTFRNALQSALFRFVTDTEKNTWNAKEPAITKKTGFNLDKDNSVVSTNVDTLATSAAVKTAYDRGTQGVNDAASALEVANQKLDAGAKAADSDKLDGIDSGGFFRDRGVIDGTSDLDTLTSDGMYGWGGQAPINAPSDVTYCNLIVRNDASRPTQMIWGGLYGKLFIRRQTNGVWAQWYELAVFNGGENQFSHDIIATDFIIS